MATKVQLSRMALQEMEQASVTPEQFIALVKKGKNYQDTHFWKAVKYLFKAANTANPKPAPLPNYPTPKPGEDLSDVQRCLFLTGDISRALDTHNRLLIATADPGYRHFYPVSFLGEAKRRGILRVWCDCRPSPDGTPPNVALDWLDELGLPHSYFYGQCESMWEWNAAYNAGSRRMIGNLSVLNAEAIEKVRSGEVHITNETYFNVNRDYPVNWRMANAGVGSNCMAVYASVREGATYYSLRDQAAHGLYLPGRDCVYVAGFTEDDWNIVVAN